MSTTMPHELPKLEDAYEAAKAAVANATPGTPEHDRAMQSKAIAFGHLHRARAVERKREDPKHEASRRTGRNTAHV